jgi:iron complex transport system permease protein
LEGRSTATRLALVIALGVVVLGAAIALAVVAGASGIDFARALDTSISPNEDALILFEARLPRVVLGAIAGAGLGAAGAALQALLRNPLADPYVLGTSGGAALGATLAIAFGVPALAGAGALLLPLAAFIGALGSTLLVSTVARLTGTSTPTAIVLAGIVVNAFATAAITFVKVLVSSAQAQEMLFWLVGSLGYERWSTLGIAAAYVLTGIVVLTALAGRLNLLGLGDEAARSLGAHVSALRWAVLVTTSLIVAGVVSLCGLVGFVGLVVPHGVRLVLGPDHRLVIPASAFAGGAFLVLADTGSRLLLSSLGTEPPVGAITALVGCPIFLLLLVGGRRRSAPETDAGT